MLAQDAFIFRLLLKMTVGKGHSGNHYFWRARAQTFIVTPWRALPIADRALLRVMLWRTPVCTPKHLQSSGNQRF